MYNSCFHIISFKKKQWLICLSLLLAYVSCSAQEETTISVDTTYVETVTVLSKFDSLSAGDTPLYQPYDFPDSVMENLKKDEAFWYVNMAPRQEKLKAPKEPVQYKEAFYRKKWFRTLVWALIIIGFLAVLIWFLIASDVRLFRSKAKEVASVSDDVLPDDIFSINYEQELQKAIAANNYRLAVRVMYLHVLKLMADNDIIQYKIQLTNSDYLLQLFKTDYYKDFLRLTRNFEYVWYGRFELSEGSFDLVKQNYQTFKSRLPA